MSLFDRAVEHSKNVFLPEETIHFKPWKCDVTLRGLSSMERDAFEADNISRSTAKAGNGAARRRGGVETADLTNFRARLVARHIIDDGKRSFANEKGEELLGSLPAVAIEPLFTVAQRLSGFSQQDVEELEGNLGATEDDERSSDLPGSSAAPSPNSNPE